MRIKVKLADAKTRLPDPSRNFIPAPADAPFEVEASDPFWIGALADGSVVRVEDKGEAAPAPAANVKSGSRE